MTKLAIDNKNAKNNCSRPLRKNSSTRIYKECKITIKLQSRVFDFSKKPDVRVGNTIIDYESDTPTSSETLDRCTTPRVTLHKYKRLIDESNYKSTIGSSDGLSKFSNCINELKYVNKFKAASSLTTKPFFTRCEKSSKPSTTIKPAFRDLEVIEPKSSLKPDLGSHQYNPIEPKSTELEIERPITREFKIKNSQKIFNFKKINAKYRAMQNALEKSFFIEILANILVFYVPAKLIESFIKLLPSYSSDTKLIIYAALATFINETKPTFTSTLSRIKWIFKMMLLSKILTIFNNLAFKNKTNTEI